MAKQEREVERWITVNGARVPIFKDGSVGGSKAFQEAYKKAQSKNKNTKSFHENTAIDGTPIITEYTKLKDVLDAGYTMVDGMTWEPITDKLTDSQVRSKFEGGEIGFIKKTKKEEAKKAKQINDDFDTKEKQIKQNEVERDRLNGKATNSNLHYYTESQLNDETFRKEALDEMKRYERNWSYYSKKEKQNISPDGVKELRKRIKEIEDYEKRKK